MLQTIVDGVGESGHELELVFFEDGPWPAELRAAGTARRGLRGGPRAPAPSLARDGAASGAGYSASAGRT